MKMFKYVCALGILIASGNLAAAQDIEAEAKLIKDKGWRAQDAETKKAWDEIQKLMKDRINIAVIDWPQAPYNRLGELRDGLRSETMKHFVDAYFGSYELLNATDRQKLMNLIDGVVSALFGSAQLTEQFKQVIVRVNKSIETWVRTIQHANPNLFGELSLLEYIIKEKLRADIEAAPSAETKKEAEAQRAAPAKKPTAGSEQARKDLNDYVELYLKMANRGQAERDRAFQAATRGISSLVLPEDEKNAAIERMIAATPQEREQKAAPAKRPAQPAQPARPSVVTQPVAQPRPSVSEQPKRAVELKKVEEKARVAATTPARASIAEATTSAADKEKLVKIKADFWRAALSKDPIVESVAIDSARESLAKLSTVSEERKKQIIAYFEYVLKMSHDQRIMEKQRNWTLDVLSPEAWKK